MRKRILTLILASLFACAPLSACGRSGQTGTPADPELTQPAPVQPMPEETQHSEPEPAPKEDPIPDPAGNLPSAPNEETREEERAEYVRVLVDGLNIRTGAGKQYPVLGQAQRETLLCCSSRKGNWYETSYRGAAAYVSADERYTEPFSLPRGKETAERVIDEGLALLGTPYVYGAVRLHDGRGHLLSGFTERAFDCSSLMQYIFYKGAGILLDVTTRTQILQGTKVEFDALERGDLMFFTNATRVNRTGIERVGHVALYLGGGYILHTASDVAKIEKLSSARIRYFLEGRRVL